MDHRVTVHTPASGFRTGVAIRQHTLIADEPVAVGGTDKGPTPYDLLGAALGTCTAMTLRMYADRKGWPLEGITVHVEHDRLHAQDCAACETKEGKIDRLRRTITLDGPSTTRSAPASSRSPTAAPSTARSKARSSSRRRWLRPRRERVGTTWPFC